MKNSLFLSAAKLAIETNKEITVAITSEPKTKITNLLYQNTPSKSMPTIQQNYPYFPVCYPNYIAHPLAQKQFEYYSCDIEAIKKYSDDNGYLEEQDILFIWAYFLEILTTNNLKKKNRFSELIEKTQEQYKFYTEFQEVVWKNRQTGVTGKTFIGFTCDFFGIAFQDGVTTLAEYLNFKLNHFFNIGNIDCSSSILLPATFQYGNWTFNTLKIYCFSQHDGIAVCKINEKVIPLQIGFFNNQPIVGGSRTFCWLNQSTFQNNATATIVLFVNILDALNIIESFQQQQAEKYIYTACPHLDFEKMNFSFFGFRKVLLVYSSMNLAENKVKSLSKHLTSKFNAAVRYCDCEIINGRYCNTNNNLSAKDRYYADLSNFSTAEELFDSLSQIAIDKFGDSSKQIIQESTDNAVSFKRLSEITDISLSSQLRIPTIADIFLYNNSLIWGPPNAGKSFFTISLAYSMATGTDFYFAQKSQAIKVGYIDGEISSEDFKGRIIQIKGKNITNSKLLDENLIHCDLRGKRLTDPNVQDEVCDYFKKNNTQHIIIDNLLSTFPKASQGAIEQLSNLVEKLRSNGNGITIVHHANKEGKDFKGPTDFECLSQNVIRLYNSEQILELSEKKDFLLPDNIRDDIDFIADEKNKSKNVVMMAEIVKCKASRALEQRNFFFVLPPQGDLQCYNEEGAVFSSPEKDCSNESNYEQCIPETGICDEKPQKLSPISKKSAFEIEAEAAFEKLKAKFADNEFKTKETYELLGCQNDKAQKIINFLIGKNLIEYLDNGNRRRYRLINSSD